MPLSCAAFGCTNHNMMENKPSFFRFPNNDPERRKAWVKACKRLNADGSEWNPTSKHVYLCGEHFITKKPNKDPQHPDYVPSVFVYIKAPGTLNDTRVKRYESARKRQRPSEGKEESCPPENADTSTNTCTEPDHMDEAGPSKKPKATSSEEADYDLRRSISERDEAIKRLKASQCYQANLIRRIGLLKSQNRQLSSKLTKLQSRIVSYDNLKQNQSKFKYYTGLDKEKFDTMFNCLKDTLPKHCKSKLPYKDQLLLTMVKLRLNPQWTTLGDLFNSNKSSLNGIFWKWIERMYTNFSFLINWPDHYSSQKTLPHVFRQYFPRLTGIIDCTEIFINRPKNLKARAQVYSNYKKHSTVKFLVACTPHGSISFLSKAWGGRISDVELVRNSGLLQLQNHHPGDQILADRGFTLVDDFATQCGVQLIIPSFTKGKKQLSAKEVETTRQIASIRIHIERVIGLIKKRFAILSSGPIPIPMVKSISDEATGAEVTSIDKIITVCAILVNLGDSIVYKEKEK